MIGQAVTLQLPQSCRKTSIGTRTRAVKTLPGDKQPFPPGVSANPGGRPRTDPEVKAILRQRGPDAIRTILEIMDNPAEETKHRLAAAVNIADRAYGKPVQSISGPDGEPLNVAFDLSQVTDEQLAVIVAAGRAIATQPGGAGSGTGGDRAPGG